MKKLTQLIALSVSFLCAITPTASASIEEESVMFLDIPTVVSATLTEKETTKAPASVSVITRKQILDSGSRNIWEAINRVAGMDVFKSINLRNLISSRGIREMFNNKYKLLINGHAFFEPIWNSLDYYDIPVENVKRIEVIRGPGSSLYGTSAFAGVINVITRLPQDIDGCEIGSRYGSYNTSISNVSYGKAGDNLSYSINANYLGSDGDKAHIFKDIAPGAPYDQAPGTANLRTHRQEAELYIDYKGLVIDAQFQRFDRYYPLSEFYMLTDPAQAKDFNAGFMEARYTFDLSRDLKLRTRASYDNIYVDVRGGFLPNGYTLIADINGDGIPESNFDLNGDGIPETWPEGVYGAYGYRSEQCRAEAIFDYNLATNNKLLLGFFYEDIATKDVFVKSNMSLTTFIRLPGYTDLSDTANWNKPAQRNISGFFFQDEWDVYEHWYLILGGRYDDYSDVGTAVTPRCGLVYEYAPQGSVKLLYGTAFRAPSFAELYHQNNPVLVGNRDLKPETMKSFELNASHVFVDKLNSEAAVYYLTTENMIDVTSQVLNPQHYINKNRTKNWGVELTERYVLGRHGEARLGYAYCDAKDDLTNEKLAWVPDHTVNAGFTTQINDLRWDVNAHYTGEQNRDAGNLQKTYAAHTVIDSTLRWLNVRSWEFSLSVYNALDEKLIIPMPAAGTVATDVPLPETNYMAGATYRF